eukprot:863915-Amphidinium_carterae.1
MLSWRMSHYVYVFPNASLKAGRQTPSGRPRKMPPMCCDAFQNVSWKRSGSGAPRPTSPVRAPLRCQCPPCVHCLAADIPATSNFARALHMHPERDSTKKEAYNVP